MLGHPNGLLRIRLDSEISLGPDARLCFLVLERVLFMLIFQRSYLSRRMPNSC